MRKGMALLAAILCLSLTVAGAKKKQAPEQNVVKLSAIYKQANAAIKANANQDAAEQALIAALARPDVTDKDKARIYYHAARLEENKNGVQNKQAYLKRALADTALFFNPLLVMYQHLERCDSVDAIPNEKGKIHTSYTRATNSLRTKHRRNLLNGGKFFLSKNNYEQAYHFFDQYYRYSTDPTDSLLPQIASWAALCGYMVQKPERTMRYIDEAINHADSAHKPIMQEYKARSCQLQKNEPAWVSALDEGLRLYPSYDYFFVNREDVYYQHRQFQEGVQLADSLIKVVADKPLYWYSKCRMALGENNYEKCIEFADSTIARDANYVDAWYNKGIAYLNMAVIAQETACDDMTDPKCQEDHRIIQGIYQMAKPCMETVRKLSPKDTARWASALYRIYLHLNMGAEFDEIEKLLKATPQ